MWLIEECIKSRRIMKKLIFTIVLGMLLSVFNQMSFARDFSTIAKNPKILQALNALDRIHKDDVLSILNGHNTTGKPIRVMFRDLAVYGLSNCEAVTMKTQDGGRVIFINKKHETAPAETIACLIAHESQHHPMAGTKVEEIKAWLMEISTWNVFVRNNSSLASTQSDLTKRLNYISRLYNTQGEDKINGIISKNPVYAGLN